MILSICALRPAVCNEPPRALIVEPLMGMRHWLADLVIRAVPTIAQVDCAGTPQQAFACASAHAYRLALVDWGALGGDIATLIGALKSACPEAAVIVTGVPQIETDMALAMSAGAAACLAKNNAPERVIDQLHKLNLSALALAQQSAAWAAPEFDEPTARRASPGSAQSAQATALRPRERDVLRLVGKGFKVREVSILLGLSKHTITGYVRDIYRKLSISSRAEAAAEAVKYGLMVC